MSDDKKTIQKWGYHPTEEARIFTLADGEDLPEGWAARPVPKGEPEAPEALDSEEDPVVITEGKDTGEIDALHAEIAGLKSELEQANARIAELEAELLDVEEVVEDDLIEIPEDWAETGPGKHSSRIKLAKQLNPEMADVIEKDADAIEVIEAELAKRG
jgi:hypothetical protein